MEKSSINYSLKNIPLPTEDTYYKLLFPKVVSFCQRLRWRAFFYLKELKNKLKGDLDNDENIENEEENNNFGFNTEKSAPPCHLLRDFENDLTALVSNLKFNNKKNNFQKSLARDVEKIKKSNNAFVPADKTSNVYEVNNELYKKLLNNNVTSHYKKDTKDTENKINKEAKQITEKLDISKRVQKIPRKSAFITIKDHKPDFINNTKCRLINPMKSEIGKISKQKLQEINKQIRKEMGARQWINTDDVIKWFNDLKNKGQMEFINLDIVEFYPSITEELFNNALNFAAKYVPIPESDKQIFHNARKSLLFSDGSMWIKKTGLFDTTMGAYDGAECCELVGLFLLDKIEKKYPKLNFGLYRDDGLGAHRRIPGPELERTKKDIRKIFKDNGLDITIATGLKQVDFLDITMNLDKGKFWPYAKPNNTPTYVHKQSNHPPNIIKRIPTIINQRLSKLSCCEEDFNNCKEQYQEALKKSGHNTELKFTKEEENQHTEENRNRQKKRKRKITWFNPPYAANLKTNIGKHFLALIDKHFNSSNPLHKIFNRKTIKLSYSCTPNMRAIIQQH
ncbi:MAG: hypothetical protein GY694_12190, partial [Gammaproteobacteria bacterium]|nr:hypothetical protein [Gammaproteobacteria bacterium]